MGKDLYSVLGVNKDADEKQIKSAFRKLSLKWHPDKHQNDTEDKKKEAETKFKEIAEAYEVLSDPNKRKQYDMFGTVDGNMGGSSSMDAEDIMREFMSYGFGGFGGGFSSSSSFHKRGTDKKIKINVTVEDIYMGRFKEVTYEVERSCNTCGGSGSQNGVDCRCPYCGGTGMVTETKRWAGGISQVSHPCPHCNGTGYYIKNKCNHCHGTGVTKEKVIRSFKVPNIDRLGYTYKMEMEGNTCYNNAGNNGDLYYIFNIKDEPNAKYHIDEDNIANIWSEIDVSFIDCLTGCDKEIETINKKKLKLHIPAGTKDGKAFGFSGYGFHLSNGMTGQYIVKVKMIMPKLTDEQIIKIKEIVENK